MTSPFSDVPAFRGYPSPSPATTTRGTPFHPSTRFSFPAPSDSPEKPVDLESLATKLGLSRPDTSQSPSRAPGETTTQPASGDALVDALMNGQTTSDSDPDFIINICNQDDLKTTDLDLVMQYKSKGIPRSTSALLDVLEDNKTFKKYRIKFETQLKTLCGPPLTNAVNKFIGDMVSLLQPSARTALRLLILIMAQYRAEEFKTSPGHNLSSRVVRFWKLFVWSHEDDLVGVLDTLASRRDPPLTIPLSTPYRNAPGYLRLNSDFYAAPESIALVTKVMLMYAIKPTIQKLDPAHLRDRLLILKRSGHPKIMKDNDAETWIMESKNELVTLTEVATITGDQDLIPTSHELSANYRSAASAPIFKIMKEWAAVERIEIARLDLNTLETWMLSAQNTIELNAENDRTRQKTLKDSPTPSDSPEKPADTDKAEKKKRPPRKSPAATPAQPGDPASPAPPQDGTATPSNERTPMTHPTTGKPLDPNDPEDLTILRSKLPCRDHMRGGCRRSDDECRYSHDPDIIASGKAKAAMQITRQQKQETTPPPYEPPAAPPIPAAAPTPASAPAPPPSSTHHINQYSALAEDSSDSDDDFPLERISKPTNLDTRTAHMVLNALASDDDSNPDPLELSVGQIEFNARMAAREGRSEALNLLDSGAQVMPAGSTRRARGCPPSDWRQPPWQPENMHAYRMEGVGPETQQALIDDDLNFDDSVDLSSMEDEEVQLSTLIADPSNRTITHFFMSVDNNPLGSPNDSPINYADDDSDDSDDPDDSGKISDDDLGSIGYPSSNSDCMSLCYCSHGLFDGRCPACEQCSVCCITCPDCHTCISACMCTLNTTPAPPCPKGNHCSLVQCTRCMKCTACCKCSFNTFPIDEHQFVHTFPVDEHHFR